MATVLITGANRGLGLEYARQYKDDGWEVIAACRNPAKAGDLAGLGVEVVQLDVADEASVARLARDLKGRPLDLLVNNAGVYGPTKGSQALDIVGGPADWMDTLRINTVGPFLVTRALLPNLERAKGAKVAIMTSKMGSIADNTSGGTYVYRASKAALNAVGVSLAHDLAGMGVVVVLLHPGWVRTDMGGPNGLIDATESVRGLRHVIAEVGPERSGRFYAYDGKEIPW